MSAAPLDTSGREAPFGYACSHCGGCCHYAVSVNAYEIARLARRLGKSTSAFAAENTVARHGQGRVLRQDPTTGACQFWRDRGCGVYEDRPLACRIYPLGRDVTADGVEQWRRVEPHPDSKADDTLTGAIGDYVGGEDNERYMWAKDASTAWLRWFYARMSGPNPSAPLRPERFADFLDLDTALAVHCAEAGEVEPTDLIERARLHVDILYRQLPAEILLREGQPMTAEAETAGDPTGTRAEPFGYVCNRCLRCCHHKLIRLSPYEIARLARNQGQTTAAFQTQSTVTMDGIGVVLRQIETDGACVFLTPEGCGVHPDRPLACRLYPLGREVGADGLERWSHAAPHPQTEGDYTVTGVIGDFVAGQDTDRYIAAVDEYAGWVRRAYNAVSAAGAEASDVPELELAELIDTDTAIAIHCRATGETEPSEVEARKRLHLEILYRHIAPYEGEVP